MSHINYLLYISQFNKFLNIIRNKIPNVPNLRFSTFTEEWQQYPLEKIVYFYKGTGISKDQLSEDGNECILYGELYTKYKTETITEIKSRTNISTKGLFFGKTNDVIIPASGETPVDIATACCVTKDDILFGGDLNIIRLHSDNGSFISYQLNGKRKYDIARIAQGASIVHLHNDDLKKLIIYKPNSLIEQEIVVEVFTKLDKRIELQSKIIKEYKTLKNAIINHLFFCNSNLDEKIKLSKFATLRNGYAFKSSDYTDNGNYNILTIANVKGDRYIYASECNKIGEIPKDIQNHQILKINDILISLTGNVGRVSLVNIDNCLLNQRVGVLSILDENYREYIFQVISSKHFENKMILKGQGAAQKNIGNDDIESFDIPFSKNHLYMNKLVNLLVSFDKKIATEEQILNDYQSQKKYLLNNMFI